MYNRFSSFFKKLFLKVDNKLFASYLREESECYIHKEEIQFCTNPYHNNFIDKEIAEDFEQKCKQWKLQEFCYHHQGHFIIDPLMGWAFTPSFQFIPTSCFSRYIHREKLSLPSFLQYKSTKKIKTTLPVVTPLMYAWNNYFHFYNDIIGAIAVAEKLHINTTFILPEAIRQKGYFKTLMEFSPRLKSKNFYFIKSNEYIHAEEGFFIHTIFSHYRNFEAVLGYIDWSLVPSPQQDLPKNIFIGRKLGERGLINEDAVKEVLKQYGFQYCNMDDFTVTEQINLFRNAENIIGIHGAALTNIIFTKNKQARFLELFPKCLINPCYWWIASDKQLDYAAFACDYDEKERYDRCNIYVDCSKLEKMMQSFFYLS